MSKKHKAMIVRLTEFEHQVLTEQAKKLNVTKSDLVRILTVNQMKHGTN